MPRYLTATAAALLLGFLHGTVVAAPGPSVAATPLSVAYLDETALVFEARRKTDRPLPASILMAGVPLIFVNDIELACKSVHARNGDLLVFLPESRACLSLTDLFTLARDVHPDRTLFGLLDRDRQALLDGLEKEAFLVMQPTAAVPANRWLNGEVLAGVCTCPNLPDSIFDDGFEAIP